MKTALIVFGEDWGRHPSSTQHLIHYLAKERQVIWVNSIGLRRPRVNWHDCKRMLHKLISWWQRGNAKQLVKLPNNLHLIQPLVFPAARSRILRWLNRFLLSRKINNTCKQQNISHRDLWISLPSAVDFVGHLHEMQVIYYCGDDFNALAGVDHSHISQCELDLVDKADHILVASQMLWTKFASLQQWRQKLALFEHGVDLKLFTCPAPKAAILHDERPVVGFYGSIAAWLDYTLIAEVARALPHWRFVLIGRIETDIFEIEQIDNIEIFPPVPHHELPSYVQHWNVSWLPFLDCDQIKSCNPLKLKEYLASGRPVISTPFQAVDRYRHVVDIVRNSHELIAAIERCAQPHLNTTDQMKRQRTVVANESWLAKADGVSQLILEKSA